MWICQPPAPSKKNIPSGNYGLVPTCPQHTCRGGGSKNFFHNFLSFLCENQDFFGPCFGSKTIIGRKIHQKFEKKFFPEFMNMFQKKRKNCKILKFFVWPMVQHLCTVPAQEIVEFSQNHPFLSTFFKWCGVHWSSGAIIDWKFIFSEFTYISLKKNFFEFLAHPGLSMVHHLH